MTSIIGTSALLGSVIYLFLAIEYSLVLRRAGYLFLPAFLFTAVTSLSWQVYALDFLSIAFWSGGFILLFHQNRQLDRFTMRWLLIWSIPCLSLLSGIYFLVVAKQPTQAHFYLYLLYCIGMLLVTEQLIRNNSGLIKVIGIGIGSLFLYNLYLYASALIVGFVPVEIVRARVLANTTVGLILCFAPFGVSQGDSERRKLGLSRPLIFTTTSLVLAGAMLLAVSILGYLFRLSGDEFESIIQPFLLFLGVLIISYNLASNTRRARMRVWINKNFFQTKFDYNNEWRNLNDRLSPKIGNGNYYELAIQAILPIYNATRGVCYIRDGEQYQPHGRQGSAEEAEEGTPIPVTGNETFIDKLLIDNWIFVPAATDPGLAKYNHLIPKNVADIDSTLLILPLTNSEQLIGFISISSADLQRADDFDWEDLDLMRMVGKQVSNFIGYQMLSSELVVTRQFEAFHQFTTFVVHDLKNLIAQQALVVQNAGRFIDKPEFIADAINTIDNSVKKMNRMLLKMSQKSFASLEKLPLERVLLTDVIRAALGNCNGRASRPELHETDEQFYVEADPDNLTMAFTHLLTNAQEACRSEGNVDVYLASNNGMVECRIIDNGVGMDQNFIDNRLFKPFDSTKKNQGMGVGAYQCKQIVSKVGGYISVSSELGKGSRFTVVLPLSETETNPGKAP